VRSAGGCGCADYGWSHGLGRGKALWGAKDALLDFRAVHHLDDEPHRLHDIDGAGAWFRKAAPLTVQRDRYLRTLHGEDRSQRAALLPTPARTKQGTRALERAWRAAETRGEREFREGLTDGIFNKSK